MTEVRVRNAHATHPQPADWLQRLSPHRVAARARSAVYSLPSPMTLYRVKSELSAALVNSLRRELSFAARGFALSLPARSPACSSMLLVRRNGSVRLRRMMNCRLCPRGPDKYLG